ncbi:hypothetical protein IQ250_18100 [Pseudanabaenaceae cyanobacterium LEGE 13415]|nr:hypothetical protein [Pseudanabaenaceae cyanobacterium LEGE 13415]
MKISFNYPTSKTSVSIITPKRTVLVPFSSSTAQIVEVREHHETNVTSSGGGGWVSNGSGYIATPKIQSQTVRVERVWLQTPGTRERCETLRNSSLNLRVGQYLTTIYGDDQTILYHYNHNSERLEYSDKQVKSYLRRRVPAYDFIKDVITITPSLIVTVLLYLFSLQFFPPIITRIVLLVLAVQILPIVRDSFIKLQIRNQHINATMLELREAISLIPIPRSPSST